jgi:hypothetical protein
MKYWDKGIGISVYSLFLCLCVLCISVSFSYALNESGTDWDTLSLRWKSLGHGTTYQFQIAQDSGFRQIIHDKMTGQPFITIPRPPSSATYYVRVKPIAPDGREGKFLQAQSILVESGIPPPRILYPTEISEIRFKNDLVIRWTSVKGAAGYHVMLAEDRCFRHLLMDIPRVSGTSYSISDLDYGTYFLKISSIGEDNVEGRFSPRRSFILVPH